MGEQPPLKRPLLYAFMPSAFADWVGDYIKHRLGPKHDFYTYEMLERGRQPPSSDGRGIFPLTNQAGTQCEPGAEVQICIAGDWGTGTEEAAQVAAAMARSRPHYTIHLGDIYYVGTTHEINENCLGMQMPDSLFAPCRWPIGSVGSFSLNGNHEMFCLGDAYFDTLLPRLGRRPTPQLEPEGQAASYFCLENEHWRIVALDTGYNSIAWPVLEMIPFLPFAPSCALPKPLVEWIEKDLKPEADGRGLILLSHHQYYSAFEPWFPRAAQQLAQFIKRPVLWFWGHEHRFAIYAQHSFLGGISAHGRCIGHGGMPVDRESPVRYAQCPAVFVDNRRYTVPYDPSLNVGNNGFARLSFCGPRLKVEYLDLKETLICDEEWSIETETGQLAQCSFNSFI